MEKPKIHKGDMVYVYLNGVSQDIHYNVIKNEKLIDDGYLANVISTSDAYNFFRKVFNSGAKIVFGKVPEELRAKIIDDLEARILKSV